MVCWRRANFRYKYASNMIKQYKTRKGGPAERERAPESTEGASAADSDGPAQESEFETELSEVCSCSFEAYRLMLRAQGPVHSDGEDPSTWGPLGDDQEPHTLLHHGESHTLHHHGESHALHHGEQTAPGGILCIVTCALYCAPQCIMSCPWPHPAALPWPRTWPGCFRYLHHWLLSAVC